MLADRRRARGLDRAGASGCGTPGTMAWPVTTSDAGTISATAGPAFGITFEEGWRTLLRALASGETNVVVSTQDSRGDGHASRASSLSTRSRPRVRLRAATATLARAGHPLPGAGGDGRASTIAAVWARSLQLERVGAADNFFELGGNSLLGVSRCHERCVRLYREWSCHRTSSTRLPAWQRLPGSSTVPATARRREVIGTPDYALRCVVLGSRRRLGERDGPRPAAIRSDQRRSPRRTPSRN